VVLAFVSLLSSAFAACPLPRTPADLSARVGEAEAAWTDSPDRCPGERGWVADASDCDDRAALVHPGALERCIDTLDTNCDGAAPTAADCSVDGMHPVVLGTLGGQPTSDQLGLFLGAGGEVDLDGVPDVWAGEVYGYEVSVFSGEWLRTQADGSLDDRSAHVVTGAISIGASAVVAPVLASGEPAIAFGAVGVADGYGGARVQAFALPLDGDIGGADAELFAAEPTGRFGEGMAYHPDIEGAPGLLVEAMWEHDAQGVFWLLPTPLPVTGVNDQVEGYSSLVAPRAERVDSPRGQRVAWLEGDAGPVAALGVPGAYVGGQLSGAVLLWETTWGAPGVPGDTSSGRGLRGAGDYTYFGAALVVADFDGDGVDDLAVGAPATSGRAPTSGEVLVYA
jgi:hypothetical protein